MNGSKRACIYVRVSSEVQSEKCSPDIQLSDCQEYAAAHGYEVVRIFQDTEKYRVGGKMVEPSGTRADRPGFRAMLAAAQQKEIDAIIVWRSDRLFRGYRPMTDFLEVVEKHKVDVRSVRDDFDIRLVPILTFVAKMELSAKHDRHVLGLRGRLANGRERPFINAIYGYKLENGYYVVNEEEAQIIRQIFSMFAKGCSVRNEIRPALIAAGYQQRGTYPHKHQWAVHGLYEILGKEIYAGGVVKRTSADRIYELPLPPIVDAETIEAVRVRFANYKKHPDGRDKKETLAGGKVICAGCGSKMVTFNIKYKDIVRRYYGCRMSNGSGDCSESCAKNVRVEAVDNRTWEMIFTFLSTPGMMEQKLSARVAELQEQAASVEDDIKRLEAKSNGLAIERQRTVDFAVKGYITESDLQTKIFSLTLQQNELNAELTEKRYLLVDHSSRLTQIAKICYDSFSVAIRDLEIMPDDPVEAQKVFAARREIAQTLIDHVDVLQDKSVRVILALDLGKDDCFSDDIAHNIVTETKRITITL